MTDRVDLEALYRAHHLELLSWLRPRLPAGVDAEDVVQDVFVTLLRSPFQYVDPQSSRSWLYTSARSRLIECFRRLKRRAREFQMYPDIELFEPELVENAAQSFTEDAEKVSMVSSMLSTLRPTQRRVIELAYRSELTTAEIADELGTTIDGVKKMKARAMVNLRKVAEA